jgi:hypothetical protein
MSNSDLTGDSNQVLMNMHKNRVRSVLNNPLNRDIIEMLRDADRPVVFTELEEEFVETGLKTRDLVENIFELYHARIVSVSFEESEDGITQTFYSFDCDYDEVIPVVEEELNQSMDRFF